MERKIRNTFQYYDQNKNGTVDTEELKQMFEDIGVPMSDAEIEAQMKFYYENHDGKIDFEEFRKQILLASEHN